MDTNQILIVFFLHADTIYYWKSYSTDPTVNSKKHELQMVCKISSRNFYVLDNH